MYGTRCDGEKATYRQKMISKRDFLIKEWTDLFNLSKVILRILVKDELSYGTKRELCVRPDFCKVEDIVAEPLSLLGCHGLLDKQRN